MERIAAIAESELFTRCLAGIEAAEVDRVFCRHGLPHLLDVARIAWILNLERGCGLRRDVVYAAALLHDIGKPEAQCRGKREGDPDMHYYGHPEKSMEIVRKEQIPHEECKSLLRQVS